MKELINCCTKKPDPEIRILTDLFQILSYNLTEYVKSDLTDLFQILSYNLTEYVKPTIILDPQQTALLLFSSQYHSCTVLFESSSSSIIVPVCVSLLSNPIL